MKTFSRGILRELIKNKEELMESLNLTSFELKTFEAKYQVFVTI